MRAFLSSKRWLLLVVLGLAAGLLAYGSLLYRLHVEGWSRYVAAAVGNGPAEAAIKRTFLGDSGDAEARYDALFGYFLAGALRHVDAAGARIQYPGAGSANGYRVNGLEGFARTGVLLAAWIAGGRGTAVKDAAGRPIDLVAFLRRGLEAGTDPASPDYWGRMHDLDQRIVEAPDIARILWLTKGEIWDKLDASARQRLVAWLRQVDGVKTYSNNWLLMPVTVDLVLQRLGQPANPAAAELYIRFKRHYAGNGWFRDPPEGIDFYNTWGMAYELFWISRLDPAFDAPFIADALRQSADLTAHLIAPAGIPIMGRSICYRTAVPVPILAATIVDPAATPPGLAHHALDAVWRTFIAHGALADGALTQGYFGTDLRLVDPYIGPGSCQWGTRSLVLALLQPTGSAFWTAPEQPLPVEAGDYRLDLEKLGWVVEGRKATAEITITIPGNTEVHVPIQPYGPLARLREMLFQHPQRPDNHAAAYHDRTYSSKRPFFEP